MKLRQRLGTLLIIIGITVAIFPLLQQAYGAYSQWKLEREFDAAVQQAHKQSQAYHASPLKEIMASLSDVWSIRAAQAATYPHTNTKNKFTQHPSGHNYPKLGLVKMEIPKINLRVMVVDNASDWRQLAKAPAHFRGTALPGQRGNCAIAGHRNVYGSWFRHMNQLRPGDTVLLRTPSKTFTYHVTKAKIVATNNTAILLPTPDSTLTLVTCMIPYAKHRLIIFGKLS